MKLIALLLGLSLCRAGAQEFRQTASALAEYYSHIYCVPPDFVKAVIDVESGWQPNAVSTKGAVGIMQLTVPVAFTYGVANRFRMDENIRGGVAYLSRLMGLFDGELRLVAAAYYAGEERIRKARLNCADPDICRYVAAVERFYLRRRLAAISTGVAKGAERQCGE